MTPIIDPINRITSIILSKKKYRFIHQGLIKRLVEAELVKNRPEKEILKAVTGKLHQVGAAYFPSPPDFSGWSKVMQDLPPEFSAPETHQFCLKIMSHHYSTRERLPIIQTFFKECLSTIAPISSILDLACGLTPLALPWMETSEGCRYFGCDIFSDMMGFLNDFSKHFHLNADFSVCDLMEYQFQDHFQVAFLLKTLTCLDQLERDFSSEILEAIPADYLLVSFPVRSLSGRSKGMRSNYAEKMNAILGNLGWPHQKYEYPDELAYLVRKI